MQAIEWVSQSREIDGEFARHGAIPRHDGVYPKWSVAFVSLFGGKAYFWLAAAGKEINGPADGGPYAGLDEATKSVEERFVFVGPDNWTWRR